MLIYLPRDCEIIDIAVLDTDGKNNKIAGARVRNRDSQQIMVINGADRGGVARNRSSRAL